MNEHRSKDFRVAVIAALAQRAKNGMGRTALMKLTYFLQTLKEVPLAYSFRLYTYGPYEAQVLDDLKVAEMRGVVESTIIGYQNGYGYEIKPGEHAAAIVDCFHDELVPYEPAIDWAVEEFGSRTAIDLEMASTIVYVDQSMRAAGEDTSIPEIAARVHSIKPRLSTARIEAETRALNGKGLLVSVH